MGQQVHVLYVKYDLLLNVTRQRMTTMNVNERKRFCGIFHLIL